MAATGADIETSYAHAKTENGEDKHKEDLKEVKVKDSEATQVKPKLQKEKKIGHRRVDASTGQTTYKKTPSSALSGSIQRGISHTVAGLSSKPERDVLMQDFQVVETITFPSEGSSITPAHHFGDFVFRTYAPTAFRYFRDLFGIRPDDYMLSISQPLTELSNPGASGSLFFVTHDDEFIIKTVQHKEAEFLQKLLPGYYMNLVQNPRTLLPKFYGLYCVQSAGKNIRIVVMNNLLPSKIKMHLKYDLKGSTYKRKASKYERAKKNPVFKDLDLLTDLPDGLILEPEIYTALMKTMQRDCLVLQSFKIMDYSMLLAIHNLDQAKEAKESALALSKQDNSSPNTDNSKSGDHKRTNSSDYHSDDTATSSSVVGSRAGYSNHNAVISSTMLRNKYSTDLEMWAGGIPARNSKGERLLLFCGIIDILQCYKLKKKLEHTLKSMIADGDTVSVHRPAFYCKRFQSYMTEHVFKKDPTKIHPLHRSRLNSSRRAQSQPTSSTTLTTSSLARLQDRPDLLPNESPRPVLSKDGNEVPISRKEYESTINAYRRHQSVTARLETTFEVSSDTKTNFDGASQHSTSENEEESEKTSKEVHSSDIIDSGEVELSLDGKSPPVEEQSRADGGDAVEVEVKTNQDDGTPISEETAL